MKISPSNMYMWWTVMGVKLSFLQAGYLLMIGSFSCVEPYPLSTTFSVLYKI